MATAYDGLTQVQLIAELVKKDAEIAAMKGDANTATVLQTKIDALDKEIIELSQKHQNLPGRVKDPFEYETLSRGYNAAIQTKKDEKAELESVKASLGVV